MSLVICLQYLCGWTMSTHPADRERSEWPPHPDRLFMALSSGYFETDQSETEREALLWLESQAPPTIYASSCKHRSIVSHFVPVNVTSKSSKSGEKGLDALPEHRSRQERHFPVGIPDCERVYFGWNSDPGRHRPALDSLCGKLIRVGHSASLCMAFVVDRVLDEGLTEWNPGGTDLRLRVPSEGRLTALEDYYARRLRPPTSLSIGYSPLDELPQVELVHRTPFSELIFLEPIAASRRPETDDPSTRQEASEFTLSLEATLDVAKALRNATFKQLDGMDYPEWMSGHQADRSVSRQEHLAFLAIPFVGSEHATGHLLGMAMAIPNGADTDLLGGLFYDDQGRQRVITLRLGKMGVWKLRLASDPSSKRNLRSETWTGPSRSWASVTPISLDRFPNARLRKKMSHQQRKDYFAEVHEIILESCRWLHLPAVRQLEISFVSGWTGVPAASAFPRLIPYENRQRPHFHAIVEFEEPVQGPLLLGAGRFRGYGLMRPM